MSTEKIQIHLQNRFLRFNVALANEIGRAESITLLQIEYLLHHLSDEVVFEQGDWWLKTSCRKLRQHMSNAYSKTTINRVLETLIEKNLIKEQAREDLMEERKIALNLDGLQQLESIIIKVKPPAPDEDSDPDSPDESDPKRDKDDDDDCPETGQGLDPERDKESGNTVQNGTTNSPKRDNSLKTDSLLDSDSDSASPGGDADDHPQKPDGDSDRQASDGVQDQDAPEPATDATSPPPNSAAPPSPQEGDLYSRVPVADAVFDTLDRRDRQTTLFSVICWRGFTIDPRETPRGGRENKVLSTLLKTYPSVTPVELDAVYTAWYKANPRNKKFMSDVKLVNAVTEFRQKGRIDPPFEERRNGKQDGSKHDPQSVPVLSEVLARKDTGRQYDSYTVDAIRQMVGAPQRFIDGVLDYLEKKDLSGMTIGSLQVFYKQYEKTLASEGHDV